MILFSQLLNFCTFGGYAAVILPTFVDRREIFREAVLLCRIPFDAALSLAFMAFTMAAFATSAFLASTACSTFFDRVLSRDFAELLMRCCLSACFCLLITDL